jgi:hypothetical protein
VPVEIVIERVLTSVIVGATMIAIAYSPLFRALGNRLMHGKTPVAGSLVEDPRVDELAEDNAMLRRQLAEMEERLEFAERLLAQVKDRVALGAPKGP